MKNLKKLVATTFLLTLTTFLIRTVAVKFNVYLTERIGSAGIGLFQLITSVYLLFKTLAISGMTLSATRLVVDDYASVKKTMKKLLISGLILGSFAALLLYSLSGFCADKWIGDSSACLPLRILSVSLPFISLSAVFSGYFTAIRKMARYSLVQVAEQISRIGIAIFCLNRFLSIGVEYAVCGIVIGITASEIVSFSCCAVIYFIDSRKLLNSNANIPFLKRFLRIAVPDSVGSVLRSGLNTVQHLLVPISLRSSGLTRTRALSDYGIIHGIALPILLYPSGVLIVLAGLLIPEIADCCKRKDEREVSYIVTRVLTVTFIFSIATAGIMIGFARELSIAVFGTDEGAHFLRIIAPLIPIMYIDMTTDGMLKGLDRQLTIMKINILDSTLCVLLVIFLVPKSAMPGYIFTIYAGEVINFILSFRKLKKCCQFNIAILKNAILPTAAIAAAVLLTKYFFPCLAITKMSTALTIVFAVALDLVIMIITRCISSEELHWIKTVFSKH